MIENILENGLGDRLLMTTVTLEDNTLPRWRWEIPSFQMDGHLIEAQLPQSLLQFSLRTSILFLSAFLSFHEIQRGSNSIPTDSPECCIARGRQSRARKCGGTINIPERPPGTNRPVACTQRCLVR